MRETFKNRHIYKQWTEAVDGDVAEGTRVIGLKRGRLIVECKSQSLVAELSAFRKNELLETMKARLGRGVVEDIRFIVGEEVG